MPEAAIRHLSFEFDTFVQPDEDVTRQRTKKVSGVLAEIAERPKVSAPLAYFPAAGTTNADPMEGMDRGHVIMVSLSGVSDQENIVPMYPCFNQAGGLWRKLEQRIAGYYDGTQLSNEARHIKMTVDIEYQDNDEPRIPTAFLVTVDDPTANSGSGGKLYFQQLPLDKLRIPHLPTQPIKLDPSEEIPGDLVIAIKDAIGPIEQSGWLVEKLFDGNNPPILPSPKEAPRPYAVLDYLWLEKQDKSITEFLTQGCKYRHRHAAQFHARQTALVRVVNAMRNDGWLKSDYPKDPKAAANLVVGSGPSSAQIDHVFPYDKFGANLFSNALVASGQYNNSMRTRTPSEKY